MGRGSAWIQWMSGYTRPEETTMSTDAQAYLEGFDALPESSQREIALAILRRTQLADTPLVSDEELVLAADAVFSDLDRREAEDGA